MGKSKVVDVAIRAANSMDCRSLLGRSDPLEKATPYYPWIEVFTQLFGMNKAEDIAARRDIIGKIISRAPDDIKNLAPLLNVLFDGLDLPETPETERLDQTQRLDALKNYLGRLLDLSAAAKMIVLEDAHCMDNFSWDLALHVVKNRPRLLLVIIFFVVDDPR